MRLVLFREKNTVF